jgi:hypothetical protein
MTAFSHGKKLKYSELDDPRYKEKIMYEKRCRKAPTADFLTKKKSED